MNYINPLSAASIEAAEQKIVDAAKALLPLLRDSIPETDRLARLGEAPSKALLEARMFDLMTPRQYGGLEVSLLTYKEVIAELGRGDPSAAWAVNLINICNWFIATLYPKHVAEEIFSTPGGARACGVFSAIAGKVHRAEGGVVVEEGRWPFNSGVYHPNWDMIGMQMLNAAGEYVGDGLGIVPISEVTILNDWDTIGLRGSGSSTISAKNVFVKDDWIASFADALAGNYGGETEEGAWIYRCAFMPMAAAVIVFPALGAARAALDLFIARLPGRGIQYTTYSNQAEAPITHLQLGEASAKFDTADLLLTNVLNSMKEYAQSGGYPAPETRIKMRRDAGFASRLIWQGVDLLANGAGATVANSSALFNRFWRDARIANLHGVVATEGNFELAGRALLGLAPNSKLV